MTAVLVFLGAMVGAPLRYLTDRLVQSRHDSLFPWGTFGVNLVGCLVLGALTGAGTALPQPVLALVGTGCCGALTTHSTFSYETLRLADRKAYFYAAMNVTVSVIAGLGAALLAFTTTSAIV
ncbi:MAG: fluoride efflux transporter CrcB [Actinophytocola sp.]|uniref:fluoride efflux transporter CrcB n=1 Tax=Actinophytocola sp. TaxID=1872138 RepID=UPI00132A544F|nr:fluoride efflux transporter CrcB [Actinophytocola sp.]MPZ84406.1 fluoride efflux transporter CrcB [Actinophytocola sp.]